MSVSFRRNTVGRAGLEPATSGLAKVGSRFNPLSTVSSCGTTGFVADETGREPAEFHRFPLIGGEYSVAHIGSMTPPEAWGFSS